MQKTVVSISGGKDSTAMYLEAMERLQGDFLPVFADTGNEHEITLEYVPRLAERTGGPAIQWVRADFRQRLFARKSFISANYEPEKAAGALAALEAMEEDSSPFLALCLWKGIFPSPIKRFCTIELKVLPIHKDIIEPLLDAGHVITNWQGIRADESESRSRMAETEIIDQGVTAYRPLHHWTVQDVFAMHRRHGLDPNPLYKMGMSRVGCMPCIMSRKQEIAQIVRRFPEHIDKIRRWEKLVQLASKEGKATFFQCTTIPGTSDTRASIDNVVAWSQNKIPGQMKLPFFERSIPSCQSEYGLCE